MGSADQLSFRGNGWMASMPIASRLWHSGQGRRPENVEACARLLRGWFLWHTSLSGGAPRPTFCPQPGQVLFEARRVCQRSANCISARQHIPSPAKWGPKRRAESPIDRTGCRSLRRTCLLTAPDDLSIAARTSRRACFAAEYDECKFRRRQPAHATTLNIQVQY